MRKGKLPDTVRQLLYLAFVALVDAVALDVAARFGKRLRHLRTEHGLSQEKLAAEAGLARNFVSMIENGDRNVTLATVEKLAIALGCRMAELMPDSD